MEYKFQVKMKDGTEKWVSKTERAPIPSDRRDVSIEIDGKPVWVRIQQIWVHALEIEPP
jgi:hypothetical protein